MMPSKDIVLTQLMQLTEEFNLFWNNEFKKEISQIPELKSYASEKLLEKKLSHVEFICETRIGLDEFVMNEKIKKRALELQHAIRHYFSLLCEHEGVGHVVENAMHDINDFDLVRMECANKKVNWLREMEASQKSLETALKFISAWDVQHIFINSLINDLHHEVDKSLNKVRQKIIPKLKGELTEG